MLSVDGFGILVMVESRRKGNLVLLHISMNILENTPFLFLILIILLVKFQLLQIGLQ